MSYTIFISGANRGLGLEFTRQFLQAGNNVIASCRRPKQAQALQDLQREYTDTLQIVALDMLDVQAIEHIATAISTPIDILLLNAGIAGNSGVTIGNVEHSNMQRVFNTNSFAPVMLADALLPKIAQGRKKLIIAISSKMGSIDDDRSGRGYAYRGSKAALNAMMVAMSIDVAAQDVKILLLHPGWVRTDMTRHNGLIDAQTSVKGLRDIIANADHYNTGQFLDYQGKPIPW